MKLLKWQQIIVDKVNENQELDAHFFTWETMPKKSDYFGLNILNLISKKII